MMHRLTTTAVLLVALTACGGEGGEAGGAEQATADSAGMAAPMMPDSAASAQQAQAQLVDAQGNQVGTVTVTEADGGVRLAVQVHGIAPGPHGIHIHETGTCTAPAFTSAGAHFNPDHKQHGLDNPQGPHAGDLPVLTVGSDSTGTAELTNDRVTLGAGPNSLFDADGSAVVIHAKTDDQKTDPSGNSGDRIACGAIARG